MDDAAHGDAVLSAMFLTRSLLIPPEYARSLAAKLGSLPTLPAWREHGGNIVADIPGLTRFSGDFLIRRVLASRKLPSVFLYRRDGAYPLEFNAEQLPNPDSRVRLGERTDSLGMPRLVVEWRYHEAEVDAICRAFRVLASAIAQTGLGEVRLESDLRASVARALVPQGGHHIGTTRMGPTLRPEWSIPIAKFGACADCLSPAQGFSRRPASRIPHSRLLRSPSGSPSISPGGGRRASKGRQKAPPQQSRHRAHRQIASPSRAVLCPRTARRGPASPARLARTMGPAAFMRSPVAMCGRQCAGIRP
jgi:hypothetical protein